MEGDNACHILVCDNLGRKYGIITPLPSSAVAPLRFCILLPLIEVKQEGELPLCLCLDPTLGTSVIPVFQECCFKAVRPRKGYSANILQERK